jgi:NitT/TauT family transport system substrate-binding protein
MRRHRYFRHTRLVGLVVLLFLIIQSVDSLSAAEFQPSGSLERVRVAYSSISGNTASLWVTYEYGFFRKYGLDVELVFVPGGSTASHALSSGEVALAQMAGSAVVQGSLRGNDVVLIAGLINTLTFQLIVDKRISQPDLLKGASIGVTRFGSSTDFAARYALDKWGLAAQKDVQVVELDSMPALLSALQSGKIRAAMLSAPFTLHAKKSGFTTLADLQMLGLEYQHTGIATTQRLIKSRPDLVRAFLQAYVEGTYFYKTQKQEALATMAKYLKTNDTEALNETYETIGLTLLQEKPYPTVKGVQIILQELAGREPKGKGAKPEQFLNASFVKELDTAGFIDRLYKSQKVARREEPRTEISSTRVNATAANEPKSSPPPPALGNPRRAVTAPVAEPRLNAPEMPSGAQDYTIKAGDNLSKIAQQFYGSQSKWAEIYAANRQTIRNPDFLYIGQKIVIPPDKVGT